MRQARLRFADGKTSTVSEAYFPGWPGEIMAHGGEGRSWLGPAPKKRRFRRAPDDGGMVTYVEVTPSPSEGPSGKVEP